MLVAYKNLAVERPELAASRIPFETAWRLPHLDVRKPNGRHFVARDLLPQILHPSAVSRQAIGDRINKGSGQIDRRHAVRVTVEVTNLNF